MDPLVPVEKFSIDRTVFSSSGTDVPPEVSNVIDLLAFLWTNSLIFAYS